MADRLSVLSAGRGTSAGSRKDEEGPASIINQLKNQLVTTSAELLIAKGRIDELEREKKRFDAKLDEARGEAAKAKRDGEAAQSAAAADRIASLSGQVTKLQTEKRAAEERAHAFEHEVDRERAVSAGLRANLATLSSGQTEASREASTRAREMGDAIAALRNEVAELKARETAASADKQELQLRVEMLVRSANEHEAAAAALGRELESARARVAGVARDSESAQSDSTARIATLQKRNAELTEALAAAESACATLRAKVEQQSQAKMKAEAAAAAAVARAAAECEERQHISSRHSLAEKRVEAAESAVMELKSKLSDAATQLQIERTKNSSMAAIGAAHGSLSGDAQGSPGGKSIAAALAAETEQGAALRAKVRALETERDAAADILSSFIPLPSFVRERAAESEAALLAAGTSRSAASKAAAASAAFAREERGEEGAASARAAALTASTLVRDLRRVAEERPTVIDALTFMDLEVRKLRMGNERLTSQLESSKATEESAEASMSSVRRQLAAARSEIAATADDRDAALQRAAHAEAAARATGSDLSHVRELLAGEAARKEALSADLDATRAELSNSRDALDACRVELESVLAGSAARAREAAADHKAALALAHQQRGDAEAAADRAQKALLGRIGTAEAEAEGLRQDLANTSARLATATLDLDRTRAEATSLHGTVTASRAALSDAEKAVARLEGAMRGADAKALRLAAELEQALGERDAHKHNLSTVTAQLTSMRAQLSELETLDAQHREDEARLAEAQERVARLEADLAVAYSEVDAAQSRISILSEAARQDLELQMASTAKVAAELERVHKRKAAEAEEMHVIAEQSRASISALRSENEALAAEGASLRERCRALQLQATSLAGEVQEERDRARHLSDSLIKANTDQQSLVERSAAAMAAAKTDLDGVKSEFMQFVAMFSADEGGHAGGGGGGGGSTVSATRSVRSPVTSSVGQHMMSSLQDDMADIQRRLHALQGSQRSNV